MFKWIFEKLFNFYSKQKELEWSLNEINILRELVGKNKTTARRIIRAVNRQDYGIIKNLCYEIIGE